MPYFLKQTTKTKKMVEKRVSFSYSNPLLAGLLVLHGACIVHNISFRVNNRYSDDSYIRTVEAS